MARSASGQHLAPRVDPSASSTNGLSRQQLSFYRWLESRIVAGEAPPVGDNCAYVLMYLNGAVCTFLRDRDFAALSRACQTVAAGEYGREVEDCRSRWLCDAATLAGEWDAAWAASRPPRDPAFIRYMNLRGVDARLTHDDVRPIHADSITEPLGSLAHAIEQDVDRQLDEFHDREGQNLICHLLERCSDRKNEAQLVADIARACSPFATREQLTAALRRGGRAYAGPLLWDLQRDPLGTFYSFDVEGGPVDLGSQEVLILEPNWSVVKPKFPYRNLDWLEVEALDALFQATYRQAEDAVRKTSGIPAVGEGWVSESLLLRQISDAFPTEEVLAHAHPPWLGRQHLDVYLPRLNIGIEYQGVQHAEAVTFFGGETGFERRQAMDARKRELCRANGCAVVEVSPGYRAEEVITLLRALTDSREP